MKEYILYGIRKGEPDYKEEILLVRDSEKQFEQVKELATKDGFDRFRVAIYDGEAPDFSSAKILNI